jgi:PAS domain S-box-containing protein
MILAIDDAPASLAPLVDDLTAAGYDVRTAAGGEAALAAVAVHAPDLILLAVSMKGLDGLDVCRRLKAREETRAIPVILMSASADAKESVEGLQLGAADYVTTPLRTAELLARVGTHLALRRSRISREEQAGTLRRGDEGLRGEIVERRRADDESRGSLDRAERSRRTLLSTLEDAKQAEDRLRRQTAITEAINRLLHDALLSETAAEVAATCLSDAKALTGSTFGWIGEVDPAGRLAIIAASGPGGASSGVSWTPTSARDDLAIGGVWDRMLRDGKPVITKEPGALPDEVGLPGGPAGLTAFLGVPLKQDGRTVGLVALGNKPAGYTAADQVAIEALSVALTAALQQKGAERSLRQERALYQDLVNTQPAGIYRIRVPSGKLASVEGWRSSEEPAYTVELVSDRFCEILKLDKEVFATNPGVVNDLFHEADREGFARSNVEANARLLPYTWEGRLVIGGETRWAHFESHPRALEDGDVLWTGILYDITERKRAEEERDRLMTAIEQTGEVIVITDPAGVIEYVNPAFERATGYDRDEAIGRNPRILKSGKQGEAFYRELWETITSGRTWQGRTVNKRKDGKLYTEEATISPVFDAAGRIVNYVAVKHDITESLRLAEQLQQAQRMESVGRLAGGVAHDFNNMLGVILGYAELAVERVDPSLPLHGDLLEIRKAANRSADLTRQLLAFARQQTVAPRVLDLNETVSGMVKMLKRLIGEDIALVWRPGTDLWPVKVDPSQIDQIMANMCINARDAVADIGTLTIETANVVFDDAYCADHSGFSPGEFALLAVSDTGSGMDEESLAHVFEPFYTTKGVGEGTGLGLSTVYGIVTQNGGFINVYSEPGHGTTFKIYLPRHSGEAEPLPTRGPSRPLARGRETILITEDEPAILAVTTRLLERLGYTVLAAGTPSEAIRLATENPDGTHLLMTDVVMPEMNGRDLAGKLLSLQPDLKRLFMSGYTADIIAHHGVLDEGVHFIQKPFSIEDLAAKVREVLDS